MWWRYISRVAVLFLGLPRIAAAEPETLDQAWAEAYQLNPSLQSERARLRTTDEAVNQAQSHWRPSIDATGNIGKTYQYLPAQRDLGLEPGFAATSHTYGVQVTQPLFRGFRTDSETDAAENEVLSGRAKLDDAEQQLFLDTATSFLDLLRDEAILDNTRETEHVLEQKLEETRVRAKYGELTETDLRQSESRLARARVARYQAETAVTADQAAYARLVGHPPEKLTPPELSPSGPKEVEQIVHLAETRNPKVVAARYDTDEARAEVDLNKGSLLPEINLVANGQKDWGQGITVPGRQDSAQVLIQATMPLYRAGTDYSRIRAAEQTVTQRRMTLEDVRHRARESARNAVQALQSAAAALQADKEEVTASELALKGVRAESKAGTRTTLDVLNAEQELLDAKIDLAKSTHDRDLAILQIRAATGNLVFASLNLPGAAYDPKAHYDDVRNEWIGFSKDDDAYMIPATDEEAAP